VILLQQGLGSKKLHLNTNNIKKKILIIIKYDSRSQPRATHSAIPILRVFAICFASGLRKKASDPKIKIACS